ncbi:MULTISPECIES: hypothetical protein [Saccharothrix]|uniref:hypothetical protein n=1 Tax=Saccharothrix TaxID=2071 RepID=UPI00093E8D7A|nr:hypothetical protein [Saccharothrix sp. CB00851]OKI37167.1 hypothetical protein A6A25_19280 [Saccharothrix sp. CB00851]
MDGSGAGRFGYDGTQPPPPPPLYPDPLAGLVTGEHHYRPPGTPAPAVVPPVLPPPDVAVTPTRRAPVRAQARPPVRQVSGEPAAHVPHAGPARQQAPAPQPSAPPGPKKSKGGLIGCLVVLVTLSGLLFNVVREIIEAVVDLLR